MVVVVRTIRLKGCCCAGSSGTSSGSSSSNNGCGGTIGGGIRGTGIGVDLVLAAYVLAMIPQLILLDATRIVIGIIQEY